MSSLPKLEDYDPPAKERWVRPADWQVTGPMILGNCALDALNGHRGKCYRYKNVVVVSDCC